MEEKLPDAVGFVINWELDKKTFQSQIRQMIAVCREKGKVIPLPVNTDISGAALLLAQVNCDKCTEAFCCRQVGKISFGKAEYERLLKHQNNEGYGKFDLAFTSTPESMDLESPCRFWNKTQRCSIYDQRPLVCLVYPLQNGGRAGSNKNQVLSVDSRCPEGRRIARAVYLQFWHLFQKRGELSLPGLNQTFEE